MKALKAGAVALLGMALAAPAWGHDDDPPGCITGLLDDVPTVYLTADGSIRAEGARITRRRYHDQAVVLYEPVPRSATRWRYFHSLGVIDPGRWETRKPIPPGNYYMRFQAFLLPSDLYASECHRDSFHITVPEAPPEPEPPEPPPEPEPPEPPAPPPEPETPPEPDPDPVPPESCTADSPFGKRWLVPLFPTAGKVRVTNPSMAPDGDASVNVCAYDVNGDRVHCLLNNPLDAGEIGRWSRADFPEHDVSGPWTLRITARVSEGGCGVFVTALTNPGDGGMMLLPAVRLDR